MSDLIAPQTGDRFARARLIEGWDQDRLAAATAVVVGVGALGNEVVKNLALAGVGRLILCDPDTVAVSNLSRTVLFTEADVGQAKVDAAASALRGLAPGTAVETRAAELVSGAGLGDLADAGVVLGCLDRLKARMQLLGRCALVDTPLVDGGTVPWGGEVRVRLNAADPCYACALSERERGIDDLPWSCADPDVTTDAAPAAIVSTALVASWMTVAALRTLLDEPPAYRVLTIDGLTGRSVPVELTRDEACPHHRPLAGPGEPIDVSADDTVGALLDMLPDDAEPFTWIGFPVPVRCLSCGDYDENAGLSVLTEGAARIEPWSSCRACGAVSRRRFSQRLRDASRDRRLSELGVAPAEILSVRQPKGGYRWLRLG